MENNLVELKLDRIDRYFEKFKTKYKSHYANTLWFYWNDYFSYD